MENHSIPILPNRSLIVVASDWDLLHTTPVPQPAQYVSWSWTSCKFYDERVCAIVDVTDVNAAHNR